MEDQEANAAFLIRQPDPPFDQIDDAAITELWAGMKNACCTKREMFDCGMITNGSRTRPHKAHCESWSRKVLRRRGCKVVRVEKR